MLRTRRTIRLHPVQRDFRRSASPYRAFIGGRGSGKSWVACYDLIRRAKRGRTYLLAAPTYPMLFDSELRTFLAIARDLGVIREFRKSPPCVTTTTGAEILFRSADDPERLRGPNLSGSVLMEASLMPRDAYDIVIACLREAGESGWLSAAMTPRGPTHWSYEVFASGRPDTEMFRAPTRANPFLPEGFEDQIRRQYGDTQYARQELEGEFVQLEGAEWSADLIDRKDRWFTDWPATVSRVVANDPSKGAREDSDYQAFADVRVDGNGIIWCDIEANREGVQAMVERGLSLCRHGPTVAGLAVEDNDGLGMLVTEYQRLCRERGTTLNIIPIRNTVNKVFRLRRLGGYLSEIDERFGPKLRIRDTRGGRLLAGQLADFPGGEHDDAIDALELAIRVHEEPFQVKGRR